ncbi:MAG: cytochrome P450 [Alphaproteobacteria bacterium]|nr:cytochrome P450 [Alphaproteobacteria bacterium]
MTETIHRFDIAGQAFKRDPFPTLAAMRAVGPVVTTRAPIIGRITFVTTHAAVEKLLKDPDRFSVDVRRAGNTRMAIIVRWLPGGIRLLANNMLLKDDPEHRRLRKLVDGTFRRAEIEAWVPRIEDIADRLLDDLAASQDRDLVKHVARDLPLAVICEMLGLPQEDRPKFARWMASMSEAASLWGIVRLVPAIGRINRYMRMKFEERRAERRDDLISGLVHAEDEGDRLSEDELLAMCFLLFAAGHETTTHLISGGVLALLQNPNQLERLRAEPDLTPSAVEELLRFVSPVQMTKPRFPIEDTEFEGVALRKGQPLMALLAAANADPDVFENPEALDIGRPKNRHLAFGGGPHFCLGAWLARAEMDVLLRKLLGRTRVLELAVPEDELRWTERTGMRALKSLPLRI